MPSLLLRQWGLGHSGAIGGPDFLPNSGNAIVCTRDGSSEWIGMLTWIGTDWSADVDDGNRSPDVDWSANVDWTWIGSELDVDWSPDVADGASMQICISCSMIHSLKTTSFKVIGIKENTTLLF